MKQAVKKIIGSTISATDGEIGKVKDFYFDDHTWTVRYLVVETGSWLFERKVLLSPQSVSKMDWDNKVISVNLTVDQVKNSPDIDTKKPVTRHEELQLHAHYPWTNYWEGSLWAGGIGTTGMVMPQYPITESEMGQEQQTIDKQPGDPNLRSMDMVESYSIKATDHSIGDVEDFLIDDVSWRVMYMIVDTGNWLPGKKVLISPSLISGIEWHTASVFIKADAETVKNSPEYDPESLPNDEYDASWNKHYDIPVS